jgi:Na+/glutamate symporter
MLIARTGLAYAVACSSFPRRLIALLNAFIIPSYIISLLRNVLVKIALSLIGKSSLKEVSSDRLKLVGTVALSIAVKYEDRELVTIKSL